MDTKIAIKTKIITTTLLFFLKHFNGELSRMDLLLLCKNICDQCQICFLAKPN